MISYLKGKPLIINNKLIIDVNGVGYGVMAGAKLLASIINLSQVELFIYTHVKEDKLDLYGFKTPHELSLFEIVLSVSGVGPKTALLIINAGANALITSVQQANLSFFTAIPRVGKKLGQKIIIELKGKLGSLKELNLGPVSIHAQTVYDALQTLGFADDKIQAALEKIEIESLSVEQAIKQAMKLM